VDQNKREENELQANYRKTIEINKREDKKMPRSRSTIILVDDDMTNLEMGRSLLKDRYKVFPAESGEKLFEILENVTPDLILLDIEMPEMNGYEVIKKLKADSRFVNIPVIFLTARSDEDSEMAGFEFGAAEYVTKPFSGPVLLKRISRQLEISRYARLHTNLLDTVNRVTAALLTAGIHDSLDAIKTGMEILGNGLDVDHIYIWLNEEIDGEFYMVCKHVWLSDLGRRKTFASVGMKYAYNDRPEWNNVLLNGTYATFPFSDSELPERGQDELRQKDAKSILSFPLYYNQKQSGNMDVVSCRNDRILSEEEINILKSVELMFASVLDKADQTLKMQEAEEHAKQELKQVKYEFLTRMSHEMLTPMNAIMGMMQVAKIQNASDDVTDSLDKIDAASRHLLRMLNDLLEISGKKDSASEYAEVSFSFYNLFRNVLRDVGWNAYEKKQKMEIKIDQSIPKSLVGDEKRLAQIIVHLFSNAMKFTPENGNISITVEKMSEDSGTVELKIAVADDGIGISKEQQTQIFDLFEQVDSSNTRKHSGTGIGLSVTKRFVEMMGGKIWVESDLGKGATFSFTCKLRVE
jgi:signal transduction histidine kinase/CheY-like chemotaxis protein